MGGVPLQSLERWNNHRLLSASGCCIRLIAEGSGLPGPSSSDTEENEGQLLLAAPSTVAAGMTAVLAAFSLPVAFTPNFKLT